MEWVGNFVSALRKGVQKILRSKPDCVALLNHDTNKPLGRTTARTLELDEDDNGLKFKLRPPEHQLRQGPIRIGATRRHEPARSPSTWRMTISLSTRS